MSTELIVWQTSDYSWSGVGLFREDDGRLAYRTDSGCSCYSWGENLSDPVYVKSWQDFLEKWMADDEAPKYDFPEDAKALMAGHLSKYRGDLHDMEPLTDRWGSGSHHHTI